MLDACSLEWPQKADSRSCEASRGVKRLRVGSVHAGRNLDRAAPSLAGTTEGAVQQTCADATSAGVVSDTQCEDARDRFGHLQDRGPMQCEHAEDVVVLKREQNGGARRFSGC